MDGVEMGCKVCEFEPQHCNFSVGFGGSPDELGEISLDAMIMDGRTRDVGAVVNLKNIKEAISVARKIIENTYHSMIAGEEATAFAVKMGFKKTNLRTKRSDQLWRGRIPNYWKNQTKFNLGTHDTIGMIVKDFKGNIACGTSTNGLIFKIPGRVGDSPLVGAGAYCENGVGGATATGNGDIITRFVPAVKAVMFMKLLNLSPMNAAQKALEDLEKFYPNEGSALLVINDKGEYGAWATGEFKEKFTFCIRDLRSDHVRFYNIYNQTTFG